MSAQHPATALLQDLVRCPSVTPQEGGALQLLRRVLGDAGFDVDIVRFAAPNTPDVDNLFAKIGSGAPHFAFAGHADVVPPGDADKWRFDPFAGEIADGKIWGRGTADMKGGVAAFATAALSFLKKHGTPKGTISFLITGDEEGPAINGTVKLLEWAKAHGEVFDHCIVGEPTNPNALGDMIKIGRRGSLTGRLTVHGKQGHVGYPHLAENPIPAMLRLLGALKAKPLDNGTSHFDASNLEVTTVDTGNPATNVIPGEVRAVFNIRFNDLWTPESLAAELSALCATVADGARYTLTFEPTNAVAFLTTPGDFTTLVATAVQEVTGRTPQLSTTGGTSDARFIQNYCPVVEFGLVGQTMHQVDEHVAVSDVEQLSLIYERILEKYFLQQ